jgi:hypothetical protein
MKTEFMNKSKLSKRSKSIDGPKITTNRSFSRENGGLKNRQLNSSINTVNPMTNLFQVQTFNATESQPMLMEENNFKQLNLSVSKNDNLRSSSTKNILSTKNEKFNDKQQTFNRNDSVPLIGNKNNDSNTTKTNHVPLGKLLNLNKTNINGKKILTEQEIGKRLEDYKKKLMSELLKVLSEEKFKEEERELLYNKTSNLIEKKRLEKIIAIERAQSSERIMQINE